MRKNRKKYGYYPKKSRNKARDYPIYEMLKRLKKDKVRNCEKCGDCDDLEIHHIIPIRQGGTEVDTNLMVLCEKCHRKLHTNTE